MRCTRPVSTSWRCRARTGNRTRRTRSRRRYCASIRISKPSSPATTTWRSAPRPRSGRPAQPARSWSWDSTTLRRYTNSIQDGRVLATADQHADRLAVFGIEYALEDSPRRRQARRLADAGRPGCRRSEMRSSRITQYLGLAAVLALLITLFGALERSFLQPRHVHHAGESDPGADGHRGWHDARADCRQASICRSDRSWP